MEIALSWIVAFVAVEGVVPNWALGLLEAQQLVVRDRFSVLLHIGISMYFLVHAR